MFTPLKIAGMEVKNRTFMAPMSLGIRMSGIFDRRAKRFISTEQAERAVPSRTVMASRVARDDVNRSERVQKKEDNTR